MKARELKPCAKCGSWERTASRQCVPCKKSYNKKWTKDNLEYHREYSKEWRDENKDKCASYQDKYKKANPDKVNKLNADYRASKLQAKPLWAEDTEIQKFYTLARQEEAKIRSCVSSDVDYELTIHVDHIVPLQGELVCGLHVENNLQLLGGLENTSKGNIFKENSL